jgi:hypothetical protein
LLFLKIPKLHFEFPVPPFVFCPCAEIGGFKTLSTSITGFCGSDLEELVSSPTLLTTPLGRVFGEDGYEIAFLHHKSGLF